MRQKPLERLKDKQKQLKEELEVITKAIDILEKNTDWSILFEAMNH